MHDLPFTPDLAGAAADLWNRCLGDEFPLRPLLLHERLWADPNFDPVGSQAVVDGDRLVAMIGVKRQQVHLGTEPADGRGWISFLVVHPDYQGRGIGSRLLAAARTHLRNFSARPVVLGADPGHLLPGIPFTARQALDWFARRGASLGGPSCDLANLDVQSFQHPDKALATFAREPGVQFRPATAADADTLLTFMRASFSGRWTWEIEQHIAQGGRWADIMLAVEGAAVVGFARIHCPESTRLGPGTFWAPAFAGRHGGLGPIGVAPEVRKRGLGLALLSAGILELRQRGIASAVIDWTVLVGLYGQVGFRPWRWYVGANLP